MYKMLLITYITIKNLHSGVSQKQNSSGKLVTLVCYLSPTKLNGYSQKNDLVVKTEPRII